MRDIYSQDKRREIMSRIRGAGNRATELRLIAIFKAASITGWRRKQSLQKRPDFVFREQRVAVFVDGCFWHGCPTHGRRPATNTEFWDKKLKEISLATASISVPKAGSNDAPASYPVPTLETRLLARAHHNPAQCPLRRHRNVVSLGTLTEPRRLKRHPSSPSGGLF
jgi:DNA mismatch endonuclease Vsr